MLLRTRPAELIKALRPEFMGLLNAVRLWIGRTEGPRVGMQVYQVPNVEAEPGTPSTPSFTFEAVDSDNKPFVSMGSLDDHDPNSAWLELGYEGLPGIRMETVAPYTRKLPMVDAELIKGLIKASQIDGSTLTMTLPIVDSLDGLPAWPEGTLFWLRIGTSGAVYAYSAWGPEPQSGFHHAGLHDHHAEIEGGQLAQADTHGSADTDVATSSLHHTLGMGATQAAAGDHTHGSGDVDAAGVTYSPAAATDWNSDADPGNTDDALDQLAARVGDLETAGPGGGGGDAADITYTPTAATDWNSNADPGNVDGALDQLAERVDVLEATSSTAFSVWMPDAPPASAHAKSDEFEDASLSGAWMKLDVDNNMTPSEESYGLSLLKATRATGSISGLFKAAPSGDFAIWTHVSFLGLNVYNGYPSFGLMLGQDLTNNPNTSDVVSLGMQLRGLNLTHYLNAELYSKYDTWSSEYGAFDVKMVGTGLYLRIRKVANTLYFDWSTDGVGWQQLCSVAQPFTPAEIGLYVDNFQTGANLRAVFRFFRCVDGALALTDVMPGRRV